MTGFKIYNQEDFYKGVFNAMASPCEILLYTSDKTFVKNVAELALAETRRIETKYSRYQQNNLCWNMNNSNASPVRIDQETYLLLTYARQVFELSEGLFDITSGVLRKIWHFEPDARPPSQSEIDKLLPLIGFDKIQYDKQYFVMPKGMEVDFGGIGKEYCVDTVANLIKPICKKKNASFLVNLGGDLSATNFNPVHKPWIVGLENVVQDENVQAVIEVSQGAIATSGSTKRVFEYKGKNYAHILNPKTGYPVEGAPRSVSVFAKTCTLAGGMSTLAQLQGNNAEHFLKENNVKHICCW